MEIEMISDSFKSPHSSLDIIAIFLTSVLQENKSLLKFLNF